ncbi:MAG TPA: ATP-binding cassette domain-containing protein [Myxococcota bacterium]|nr:ATP-binding cassette domain-containing protein [Myxococcota bacterium]HOD07238.1 ATP-binding cassette domain-containing protein [Myxococcota bacterium]
MRESSSDQPAVSMSGVNVSFEGHDVLRQFDLQLAEGLVHGILGRGGSGRTTLMRAAGTILRPDSGTVSVFGVDVTTCTARELDEVRSFIGFQFQNLALFDSMSVLDNVLFSLTGGEPENATDADRNAALAALEGIGLAKARHKLVQQLSGGMQRRLAIARALAPPRARLLFFDDPAGGLDPVSASSMLRFVTSRHSGAGGRTLVISGHDTRAMLENCHLLHVLHNGRIAFSGTPEQAISCRDAAVASILNGNRTTRRVTSGMA